MVGVAKKNKRGPARTTVERGAHVTKKSGKRTHSMRRKLLSPSTPKTARGSPFGVCLASMGSASGRRNTSQSVGPRVADDKLRENRYRTSTGQSTRQSTGQLPDNLPDNYLLLEKARILWNGE